MDPLTPTTSHGDTSPTKLRKDKRKSAKKVPKENLFRDNTSLASELHQVEDGGKMKKLKEKKHKSDEVVVTEFRDCVQPDKKKRKLNKDVRASGDSDRVEPNMDASSSPKRKKRSKVKNDDICIQNQVENLTSEELGEVAGKKKKKKKRTESKLSILKESVSGEQCVKNSSVDFAAQLESNSLSGVMAEIKSYEPDIIILEDDTKIQRKEKKLKQKILGCKTSTASHQNKCLEEDNNVEKLWHEIKLNIESKIQEGRKSKTDEAAAQQSDDIPEEDYLDDVEGGCYSMVFKFDNNPSVRHYIPKKLMALSGLGPKLPEMTEINLEIPRTFFKGSSLDRIQGYGYNT